MSIFDKNKQFSKEFNTDDYFAYSAQKNNNNNEIKKFLDKIIPIPICVL